MSLADFLLSDDLNWMFDDDAPYPHDPTTLHASYLLDIPAYEPPNLREVQHIFTGQLEAGINPCKLLNLLQEMKERVDKSRSGWQDYVTLLDQLIAKATEFVELSP